MKARIMLWAAIPVAAALLAFACSENIDILVQEQPGPDRHQPTGQIIPYTVTITGGSVTAKGGLNAVGIGSGQEFTSTDDALRLDDSYPLPTFDHLNAVRSADNTLLLTPKN